MAADLDLGATIKGFVAGQKLFNRYTLTRILGRGGMGVVWLARDEELGRDAALKFLPEMVAMDANAIGDMKKEVRRAIDLAHPHIVKIHDFVTDGRTAAVSMEYVTGHTLAALRQERPERVFTAEELRPWVKQLCDALEYAHGDAQVVHRDLKAANLMIDGRGRLKVLDFGIAASLSDSVSRVSNQGSSGTPVYMSPQQMMGEDPAVTDDVYALGATLFELLVGKPPFHSGNIILQVQNKPAPLVNERRAVAGLPPVPAAWEQAIAACLAKEPSARPASAQELWRLLEGGARPATGPTKVPPVPTPTGTTEPVATPANPGPAAAVTAPTRLEGLQAAFTAAIAGGILWAAVQFWLQGSLYNLLSKLPEPYWGAWRSSVYPAWFFGFAAAPLLAQWLVTGRTNLVEAAKPGGFSLLAAIVLSELAWSAKDASILNEYNTSGILVVTVGLVATGAVFGWLLAFQRRSAAGFTKRAYVIFPFLGALGSLAGAVLAWLAVGQNALPDRTLMATTLALGLQGWWFTVLLGAASLRATATGWSPRRQMAAPLAAAATLSLVAMWGLQMFWRRGNVYAVAWDQVWPTLEAIVLAGWALGAYGLSAVAAPDKSRRLAWGLAGLVALAALLVTRFYWREVDALVGITESVVHANYGSEQPVPVPSPLAPIMLGLVLVAGGAIALRRRHPLTARVLVYDLVAAVAAGMAGYGASRLPYDAPSIETLYAFPIWAMVLAVALVAFAWSHLRLVVAMRGPAAAQAN